MKKPGVGSLRGYRRGWLRGDVVAGLTVWAVLVPESLAYATIGGVSPVVGLYTAPGALVLYAAFGSLRLGFLASFISKPLLGRFIVGLAITVIAGQLPKIFGIKGADGNCFEKLWGFVAGLGEGRI